MPVKEINIYMIHSADGASLIRPTELRNGDEICVHYGAGFEYEQTTASNFRILLNPRS
jgi:hypothetical protein